MRAATGWVVVVVAAAAALGGCGEGGLPLDELPLRDALRADPEVIATLPPAARLRLGARLETARATDDSVDQLSVAAGAGAGAPAAVVSDAVSGVVSYLDSAREHR